MLKHVLLLTIWSSLSVSKDTITPIVIWHGMGDSCCNPLSLGSFTEFLKEKIPGVYVNSLEIGDGIVEDTLNGYFMNVNDQVELACKLIKEDPKLKNGFNALGFSQGGQFLRAVAQRCYPTGMKNLITFGGQHQGIYGLPHCPYPDIKICDYIRQLINYPVYWSWLQKRLVQAQYWHDPMDEEWYIESSTFLADINNEKEVNELYKKGLNSLEKFVMVMFENDTMVEPKETSWFSFYASNQSVNVIPLSETRLYTEDRLGLKEMDQNGKIVYLVSPGDHLRFTREWFTQYIIKEYLI